MKFKTFCTLFELQKIKNHYKHCITNVYSDLFYALGGNRTPILRTGISRAIRCTTRALCSLRMLTVRIIIIAKFIWFYKLYFNEEASKSEDLLAKVVILLMSK